MARQMATDELETTWFVRHGSKPITQLPDHWPEDYKRLVERRIELIEHDPYINLAGSAGPIGVFARLNDPSDAIKGWEPTPDRKRAWWSGTERRPAVVLTTLPRRSQHRDQAAMLQASLFPGMAANAAEAPRVDWIGDLLGSPIFVA